NGCRSGGGFARSGPMPGTVRTAYPTARAVACAVYHACQKHHTHPPEQQSQFVYHEFLPPKLPSEYIDWTPPPPSASVPSKAKRSTKAVPLQALKAKKRQIQSKASKASLPNTPKDVKPRGTSLVSGFSRSPPGASHVPQSSSPESAGSPSPSYTMRFSPRLPPRTPDDRPIAHRPTPMPKTAPAPPVPGSSAVPPSSTSAPQRGMSLFVLENGEVYADGKAAEAALKTQRLAKLKVVNSLDAAQRWLEGQGFQP
ncbi:hypothetical protein B0H15DRAFT_807896, partial [Mycena belliarum]